MASKRKDTSEFDKDINTRINQLRDKFDRRGNKLYEDVDQALEACREALEDEPVDEEKIDKRDKDAFKTLEYLLSKASSAEEQLSDIWIEYYAKKRKPPGMSDDDFEDINGYLTDGRTAIDDTLTAFYEVCERLDNKYLDALHKAVDGEEGYRKFRTSLEDREGGAAHVGPSGAKQTE